MKIGTESNRIFTARRDQESTAGSANSTTFSSALSAASTESSSVKQVDFTSMTRKELFDWMNGQIRSGKISLDESTPFKAMTVKISAATGQPVDIATDATRLNFVEKALSGIEYAIANNDPDSVRRFQAAVEIMRTQQGLSFVVDKRA